MITPLQNVSLPRSGLLSWGFQRSATHTHNGVDMPAKEGTPVRAAAAGVVTHASSEWSQGFTGYGRHVVIEHPSGIWTLYAHLSDVDVAPGDHVAEGERIGAVGNTAFTAADHSATFANGGYHLHFEVSPRAYPQASTAARLDPVDWLAGAAPSAPSRGEAPSAAARFAVVLFALLGTAAIFVVSKHARHA